MTYRLRIINIFRHLIFTLLIIFSTGGLSILLSEKRILTNDNPVFFVLLFGGLALGFLFSYYYKPKYQKIEINEQEIKIKDYCLKWTEIESFKIKDDSPEFTIIKLKTKSKNMIKIGHRNRTQDDDFDKFIESLENRIEFFNKTNQKKILIIPQIWDTSTGKIIGYIIIFVWIFLTILSINKGLNIKTISSLLIFTGITIPLLIRIFFSKK